MAIVTILCTSCSPTRPPLVAVVIPGERALTAGCEGQNITQHEYVQQRSLLCRDAVRAQFIFFDQHRLEELVPALQRAGAADVVEMPFEICPDALRADVRRTIVRALHAMSRAGKLVVAAAGNRGSLRCRKATDERFPADVDGVISVGSGTVDSPQYTLRWRDKPDYLVSWDGETLGTAGTSFASARFVLWQLGFSDGHTRVVRTSFTAR